MTQTVSKPDQNNQSNSQSAARNSDNSPARQSRLNTDDGKITVAQGVVQKIAGMATREVSGVYSMGNGSGTSRAFNTIRDRIPGSTGPNVAQGVGVEVGETEAAVDLDIVVDYGASIAELGRSVQRNVTAAIERMTGLDVVEVNVSVNDIHLPDSDGDSDDKSESRVS
jgi:uncharacterized alkaline shock family protein YloU